jgi:protein-S-isoprenylcysteine O-methyltransferase Ste14
MSEVRPGRRSGIGTVIVALVLIAVGGYYVLRNTLGLALPELESEAVVPVIAVLFGVALLFRFWQDRTA